MISPHIYDSWKQIQWEKYEKIVAIVGREVFEGKSILDVGIGFSWFEEFLEEKGIKWKRLLGVDPNPRRMAGVEYFEGTFEDFLKQNKEKWDTVVCIDTYHLLKKKEELWGLGKFIIVALPFRFARDLELKGKRFWIGGSESEVMVCLERGEKDERKRERKKSEIVWVV